MKNDYILVITANDEYHRLDGEAAMEVYERLLSTINYRLGSEKTCFFSFEKEVPRGKQTGRRQIVINLDLVTSIVFEVMGDKP